MIDKILVSIIIILLMIYGKDNVFLYYVMLGLLAGFAIFVWIFFNFVLI